MSATGNVRPGFKHIRKISSGQNIDLTLIQVDVLNRCLLAPLPKAEDTSTHTHQDTSTLKVMMYIFPRQFGLHNVFTSQVDRQKTAQKFQDYTMREHEIEAMFAGKGAGAKSQIPKVPKRLRGDCKSLVGRLQTLHRRCSYLELLNHYCPQNLECSRMTSTPAATQPALAQPQSQRLQLDRMQRHVQSSQLKQRKKARRKAMCQTQAPSACQHGSVTALATPASQVSAFCRATLKKVIPHGFWGNGVAQEHNLGILSKKIDHFVRLRRFETMSLHEIVQGFKVSSSPILLRRYYF